MAIWSIRLSTALYRRAFCQVRVFPFDGFSTWRRSSLKQLFDNSAAAASAARTEALQDPANVRECERGASNHAARSKCGLLQGLQLRARARSRVKKPASADVLARAAINPVKDAGCECGGGRGRISGERRTLVLWFGPPQHGAAAAEAASLVSDGHLSGGGHVCNGFFCGRGRISGERRTRR
jgi:hypothetical protein